MTVSNFSTVATLVKVIEGAPSNKLGLQCQDGLKVVAEVYNKEPKFNLKETYFISGFASFDGDKVVVSDAVVTPAGDPGNAISIVGRLGKDPELRFTEKGLQVCKFSLAVSKYKAETTWFNVTMFGKSAEIAGQYLKKGQMAGIQGRLKFDTWEKNGEKKYAFSVTGDRLYLMGKEKSESQQSSGGWGDTNSIASMSQQSVSEEIPF